MTSNTAENIRSPDQWQFAKWFDVSKVTDADGRPLMVYHGAFSNIEAFTISSRGLRGSGAYFTSSKLDASQNYANKGKLNGLSIDTSNFENMGVVYPVYLSLKNPIQIGGENSTSFFASKGTLNDLKDAFIEASFSYPSVPALGVRYMTQNQGGFDRYAKDGNLGIEDAIAAVTNQLGLNLNFKEDVGKMDLLRKAFELLGYDGIVDSKTYEIYGHVKQIEGVNRSTTHYVAFRPEQVKFALSCGTSSDLDHAKHLETEFAYMAEAEQAPQG